MEEKVNFATDNALTWHMSEFHYSIIPDAKTTSHETLWSFNGVNRYPGPSGSVILHKRRKIDGTLCNLTSRLHWGYCSSFRTLERHTRTIIEAATRT